MITAMGANGNTGRRISELLLRQDEHVRALGRSTAKLAAVEGTGGEVLTGVAADACGQGESASAGDEPVSREVRRRPLVL